MSRSGRGGGAGGNCPLDLHRLVPVPEDVLRLGRTTRKRGAGCGRTGAPPGRCGTSWNCLRPKRHNGLRSASRGDCGSASGRRTGRPGQRCPGCAGTGRRCASSCAPLLRCGLTGRRRGGGRSRARGRSRAQRSGTRARRSCGSAPGRGRSTCCWSWRAPGAWTSRGCPSWTSPGSAAQRWRGPLASGRTPLARLAEWLVMAAHLALLRSRLCFRRTARRARTQAARRRRCVGGSPTASTPCAWPIGWKRRPQLGRDVFARGAAEDDATAARSRPRTLRRCSAPAWWCSRGAAGCGTYRPEPLLLWRVPDALARLRRMLPAARRKGAALESFLPEAAGGWLRRGAAAPGRAGQHAARWARVGARRCRNDGPGQRVRPDPRHARPERPCVAPERGRCFRGSGVTFRNPFRHTTRSETTSLRSACGRAEPPVSPGFAR